MEFIKYIFTPVIASGIFLAVQALIGSYTLGLGPKMNHFISTLWEEGIIRTSIFGFIANLISTDFVRRLDRGVQKIPPAISVAYKVVATTIFPDFEMFADTRFRSMY